MADVQVPISTHAQKCNVNPSINLGIGPQLVDHANRLGITLRSAGRIRTTPSNAREQRATTAYGHPRQERLSLSAWDRPYTSILSEPQYVQDFIVPLSVGTDEENARQAVVQHSLKGNKQLPYMNRGVTGNMSARSARSNFSTSTYLSKYMTSTPGERAAMKQGDKENRNSSDQALRFQHEQDLRQDGMRRKRVTEVRPHRVDRMYYMSGTQMGMGGRYSVDQQELARLKDLSKVRRDTGHYGRGLSIEKRKILQNQEDFQLPRQPPPSQLDDRVHSKADPRTITVASSDMPDPDRHDVESAVNDASLAKDYIMNAPEKLVPPQNTARTVENHDVQDEATERQTEVTQGYEGVRVELQQESSRQNQDMSTTEETNQNAAHYSEQQEPIKIESAADNENTENVEETGVERVKTKTVNFEDSKSKKEQNEDGES